MPKKMMVHARICLGGAVIGALIFDGAVAADGGRPLATTRPIAEDFDYISNVAWPGEGHDSLFILEQHSGAVWAVDGGARRRFLDIGDRLIENPEAEEGLLGLAFPVDFPEAPEVYVSYINDIGELQVSRFNVVDGGQRADPSRETAIIRFKRSERVHNCGHIVISRLDGNLYVCIGDSTGNTWRGAVLPDGVSARANKQGMIVRVELPAPEPSFPPFHPSDYLLNVESWLPIQASAAPTEDGSGDRMLIKAKGLRNPWHFAIDAETGTMFIPDAGRDHWEEINFQPLNAALRDYGWPLAEGNECLREQGCAGSQFTWPVHVYRNDDQQCSIVGGAVYRGATKPDWEGVFVFGDHCSGEVWALRNVGGSSQIRRLSDTDMMLTAIGLGPGGEVVLADGAAGAVHHLSFPEGDADQGWIDTEALAAERALSAQRSGFGRVYESQRRILESRQWRWAALPAEWYASIRELVGRVRELLG